MCLHVRISPRDSVSLHYLPLIVIIAMILLGCHSTLQTLSNNLSTFFVVVVVVIVARNTAPPAALLTQPHHSGSGVQLSGAFLAPCWKVWTPTPALSVPPDHHRRLKNQQENHESTTGISGCEAKTLKDATHQELRAAGKHVI